MTGDCHVRFCERLGAKLPRPTDHAVFRRELSHMSTGKSRVTKTLMEFRAQHGANKLPGAP